MVLEVIVIDSDEPERLVEVDDAALLFFDTFVAAVSPLRAFNCFKYRDDEGDLVAVRTDAELAAMLSSCEGAPPIHIFIDRDFSTATERMELDAAPMVPESLKRLSLISSGHSGTVYKALDINRDKIIAVKCILVDGSAEVMSEVLRETTILKKCSSSPYIVDFLTAMLVDCELCLCMEFMNGGSLDRYGKLPSTVLPPVTASVILGLAFLWSQKVMHRDIKPSNFLVNSKGEVKLSDFGESKQLEQSVARSYVGTNAYMAPERLYGGTYRICSDIWSLGVALCEMAIGRFPLADSQEAVTDALQRVAAGQVDVSSHLTSGDFSKSFCDIICNSVIVDETKRWSPEELINCDFVLQNTPIDRRAVSAFVLSKNLLL